MDKRLFKTIVLAVLVCLIPVVVVWKFDEIRTVFSFVLMVIRPLIIGGASAFILNRPFNAIHRGVGFLFRRTKLVKLPYIISIVLVYLLFLGILTGIVVAIIPEFIENIKMFVGNFDDYYNNLVDFINNLAAKYNINISEEIERYQLAERLDISGKLSEFAEMLPSLLWSMVDTTRSIIGVVTDLAIGVVISVYLLAEKRKYKAQSKRLLAAMMSEKRYHQVAGVLRTILNTFANFVNGQLIEACILGILCFIGMSIFGFKYAVLISVIMAVTNVIPIVGPILGTIPAALILLLVKPQSVLWFILFIILLQQFESNVIYPRVVGSSVGLPAFWVLLSITIGGGLFGVLGMVAAVPTASVIYYYGRDAVAKKLKNKKWFSRGKKQKPEQEEPPQDTGGGNFAPQQQE